MSLLMKNNILFVMADFETSLRPDETGVYAWLTGFKICGLMNMESKEWQEYNNLGLDDNLHYYYGKKALKNWLDNLFKLVDICYQNDIGVKVFFHNAKYDFHYILYYVLNECNGYKNKLSNYYINGSVIDENNTFYSAKINYRTKNRINGKLKAKTLTCTVHDLYKILPSKLADIGNSLGYPKGKDFDYEMIRPYDYIPTTEELEGYFYKDIEIMCKAYKSMPKFFYGKYTIGSIVKNLYLTEYLPRFNYKESDIFPNEGQCTEYIYQDNELKCTGVVNMLDVNKKLLQAYKGGMCICNKKYLGKVLYNNKIPNDIIPKIDTLKINEDIFHDDVNSLYPSVMENNSYPVGKPIIVYSDYMKDNTKEFEKYLIKEMQENKKKIIIQVCILKGKVKEDKAPLFLKKDLNKELYNIKKDNDITIDNSYKAFYESMEYNVENITLEEFLILKKNYNMNYRIKYAIIFNSMEGLFDNFIQDMSKKKIEYDKDEFLRNCFKLCMNNLYGKFGEKIEKITLIKNLDENGDWLINSNYDKEDDTTNTLIKKTSNYFYPAVAVYVTSYARIKMINFINLVGWDNILYMDTDSLHIIGKENQRKLEENNCIDNTRLGYLKLEDIAYGERVLSPKKYCFYGKVLKKNKEIFKVKCAGLPDDGQKQIKTFDQYYYGLTFIPENLLNEDRTKFKVINKKTGKYELFDLPVNNVTIGKLAQKNIKGGIYLCPCLFSIRIPDYIKLENTLNLDNLKIETCIL